MKTTLILLIMLMGSPIKAEVYADFGLGISIKSSYEYQSQWHKDCSSCVERYTYDEPDNPYGTLEIGYTANNISVYFLHISSIPDSDGGINMAGIKYRFKIK